MKEGWNVYCEVEMGNRESKMRIAEDSPREPRGRTEMRRQS